MELWYKQVVEVVRLLLHHQPPRHAASGRFEVDGLGLGRRWLRAQELLGVAGAAQQRDHARRTRGERIGWAKR